MSSETLGNSQYKNAIIIALTALDERGGSSLRALKRHIQEFIFPRDKKWINGYFLQAVNNGVKRGDFIKKTTMTIKLSPIFKQKLIKMAKEPQRGRGRPVGVGKKTAGPKPGRPRTSAGAQRIVVGSATATNGKRRGRPPGSKNIVKSDTKSSTTGKSRGRPPGSKNVVKSDTKSPGKLGRPKGKSIITITKIGSAPNISSPGKKRGRPPGSPNKKPKMTVAKITASLVGAVPKQRGRPPKK